MAARVPVAPPTAPPAPVPPPEQQIRFCRSVDGTRLAYATHGSGPPVVVVSCWLSHLQYDWQSPVWRHFLDDLGRLATVIRYDERGFGMSDWNVTDFSVDARVRDLEAVLVASGHDRVALLGMSGGSATAMAFAARNPNRVTRLVLYGSVRGHPVERQPDAWAEEETYRSLIRVGWAREDPVFRRVFTSRFIPDATEEQMRWFDDLQRVCTSAQNALGMRIANQSLDISDELPGIAAPTLVLQATGDRMTPFSCGVHVSSVLPNARLVPMDSRNHILLADEPAWQVFVDEVSAFLAPDRTLGVGDPAGPAVQPVSPRELNVVRLAAEGLTNDEIADALTLSCRTVERHLSNVYAKLGLTGRAARAAAVAEFLRGRLA